VPRPARSVGRVRVAMECYEYQMRLLVSVIVPTLDEELALPAALDRLDALSGRLEVIVADGGSRDGTLAAAWAHPSCPRVITAAPSKGGRGAQLNAAAAVARGDVLLFLHADTQLPPTAYESLATAYGRSEVVGGNFALRFEGDDRFSRLLGSVYALLRRAGFYYGDSALFVRRTVFEELGGFRPLDVMDDYDFVRRLERRGKTECLPGPAITSGRRWRRQGALRTMASWIVIQALFLARITPSRLGRRYRRVR
jgi:rSAM/selenodomain-associated transferase 2